MSVGARASHCTATFPAQDAARSAGKAAPPALAKEALACALYPMKWAVLLHPAADGQGFDTVTVVLAERNWHATTGRLDAMADQGPNVAVQAALLLAQAQR